MDSHTTDSKIKTTIGTTTITTVSVLGGLLILLLFFNIWQTYSLQSAFPEKVAVVEKPKIELAIITANSCTNCFDITTLSSKLSSLGVEVTDEITLDYQNKSAQAFLSKYKVSHVPALIIKGDVEKSEQLTALVTQLGTKQEENYIIPSPMPPYIDLASGKLRGEVTIIILKKEDCTQCSDVQSLVELLKQQLLVTDVKTIDMNSAEGKILATKYNITVVPTLIFNSEAALYPAISSAWKNIGSVEKDGSLVMRSVNPPFYSLPEGKVKGLVTLTTIEDKSCTECYNASINKLILRQMGIQLSKEKTLELLMPEAQGLVAKYKITKVPTIVLTGDMDSYPTLARAWKDVGSVESDGAYVLRKVELFEQPYKDLEQKKMITPAGVVATEPVSASNAG